MRSKSGSSSSWLRVSTIAFLSIHPLLKNRWADLGITAADVISPARWEQIRLPAVDGSTLLQHFNAIMHHPSADSVSIRGFLGNSGDRQVILGFASAKTLAHLSFADVLDERTGEGYQRRFSEKHSLDFRRYIRRPGSTTIPLTFNLRPRNDDAWTLRELPDGGVELTLSTQHAKLLAQVDCQHRLGHVGDLDVTLPVMIFVGLTEHEELEIFNIINGKAKGLSSSLLDFHDSRLVQDLGNERPELLIALHLNDSDASPWYKQLDLGGRATSGMKRRASLRTIQKAIRRFLSSSSILESHSPSDVARIVTDFWSAVAAVWDEAWSNPRRHYVTKGIGVYALMGLLGDLWLDMHQSRLQPDQRVFAAQLGDFAHLFDWTNQGPLRGLGGEGGAAEALKMLRRARRASRLSA